MIPGHATPQGTLAAAQRHEAIVYRPLGQTGLMVSAAGFGGYRISHGVTVHDKALSEALSAGINLIDTSANYADGESERLVGQVMARLVESGMIRRDQVVVISKGGYIQGSNIQHYEARKARGRPFEEVVPYAEGLLHCIHPDFLADQIERSGKRLGLEVLDGYLLHNPEYYLDWAHKQGVNRQTAGEEYYRRIEQAFGHLETEVARGRIGFYGVSSNTFGADADDPESTALPRLLEIAESIDPGHHFALIQLPFNLFESGALTCAKPPGGQPVIELARKKGVGVLTNRPLNAFANRRMIRLARVPVRSRMEYKEIIARIKRLAQSETVLWRKVLPAMDQIPGGIQVRIKQQACFAESLKHHWRSFGSYERWREAKDGIFLRRIQGVIDYLEPMATTHPPLADWMADHHKAMGQALDAITSIYAEDAVALEKKIGGVVQQADAHWAQAPNISRMALRALMTTSGVSAVLVGMRKTAYVDEVLAELAPPDRQAEMQGAWERLRLGLEDLLADQD